MASHQVHDLNAIQKKKTDDVTWDDLREHPLFKGSLKSEKHKKTIIILALLSMFGVIAGCYVNSMNENPNIIEVIPQEQKSTPVISNKLHQRKKRPECFSNKIREEGITGGVIRLSHADCPAG